MFHAQPLKLAAALALVVVSAFLVVFANHGAVDAPVPVAPVVIKSTDAPAPADPVVIKLPGSDFRCAHVTGDKIYVVVCHSAYGASVTKFGFIDIRTGKFTELNVPTELKTTTVANMCTVVGGPDGTVFLCRESHAFQYDAEGKLMGQGQLNGSGRLVATWNGKAVTIKTTKEENELLKNELLMVPLTLMGRDAPAPAGPVVIKLPALPQPLARRGDPVVLKLPGGFQHVAGDKVYVVFRNAGYATYHNECGFIDIKTGEFTALSLPRELQHLRQRQRCTAVGGPNGTVIVSSEAAAFQYDAEGKLMGQLSLKEPVHVVGIWNGKAVTTGKDENVLHLEPLALKVK